VNAAIEIHGLNFSYGGPRVLQDLELVVPEGEFLGVVGPNAGGKSTLLKLVLGLLTPRTGRVRVLGRTPEAARNQVGYVPQYPQFRRDFPITVEQVVLTGRLGHGRWFGGWSRTDREAARRAMREAEVHELAGRRIETLSGGQLQRVLVSRALAGAPRILILDEPTANIDMRVESDIFDLLKVLNARMTIVVVSHDVAFISKYVHRVACLNRTLICHRTADIDGKAIRELYGEDVRMVAHAH
jgi:zinc transport system ATP-binding protein